MFISCFNPSNLEKTSLSRIKTIYFVRLRPGERGSIRHGLELELEWGYSRCMVLKKATDYGGEQNSVHFRCDLLDWV